MTDTIYATAGGNTYDFTNDATPLLFVGNPAGTAPATVLGGSGNATLFAAAGVNFTEGSGSNVYIGGTGPSTITGSSGHDLLFGGKGGDLYNVGNASETYVNGGGQDTITGGSVAPTVYGNTGGTDNLVDTKPGILVAYGKDDILNADHSAAGNEFIALNVPAVGDSHFEGSREAPVGGNGDRFAVENVAGAQHLAHKIFIDNFGVGAAFFLEGYSVADQNTFTAAVAASDAHGGPLKFTLSDNTTVQFNGSHPTAVFGGGTIAI